MKTEKNLKKNRHLKMEMEQKKDSLQEKNQSNFKIYLNLNNNKSYLRVFFYLTFCPNEDILAYNQLFFS